MKPQQIWTDKVQDAQGAPQIIYDVIFLEDGSKVIAAAGAELLVYDAIDGSLLKAVKAHKEPVTCLCPLIGMGFASGGSDKQVIIWNAAFQGTLKYSHNDTIQALSQNPITGVVLSCTGSDFGLWSPEIKAVPKTKVSSRICCCSWAPDGQYMALGLFNGNVSIRTSTGEERVRIERGNSPIWSLSWSPSLELESNVLAVADWNQKLSFFQDDGKQVGKDKPLGFDPCNISYFGSGEFLIIGGSNKQAQLWTAEGLIMGSISTREGWVWSCKAKQNDPYVIIGAADGTVSLFKINFNNVQSIYGDKYAYRRDMTDILVQGIESKQKSVIKCRDYIKKISIFKDIVVAQLSNKIVVYELYYEDNGEIQYRILEKVLKNIECDEIYALSKGIITIKDNFVEMMSMSGEIQHEWKFDSKIVHSKLIGGPTGKEALIIALKEGNVYKILSDNPFPISLIQHKFQIISMDIDLTKSKIAIVDDEKTCSVYDISSKELYFQEPNVEQAIWNSELDDSICFYGQGSIYVKIQHFPSFQQQFKGNLLAYKGSTIYYAQDQEIKTLDVPQTSALLGFIDLQDYDNAIRIASCGATESEWNTLAISALEHLSLEVAKKAFSRTKNSKFLEAIQAIEKMKKEGQRETDLFMAQVAAYCENYNEV